MDHASTAKVNSPETASGARATLPHATRFSIASANAMQAGTATMAELRYWKRTIAVKRVGRNWLKQYRSTSAAEAITSARARPPTSAATQCANCERSMSAAHE